MANPRARKFWGRRGRGSGGSSEGAILCKGDLPRRREKCHLSEEGTESQSQMGDRGVGRDAGREQWCAGLRGHSISNSCLGVRNKPSRRTHTEQTCLPVTGHSRARFTSLPYCGFSQRPLPSNPAPLSSHMLSFPNHPTSHG